MKNLAAVWFRYCKVVKRFDSANESDGAFKFLGNHMKHHFRFGLVVTFNFEFNKVFLQCLDLIFEKVYLLILLGYLVT